MPPLKDTKRINRRNEIFDAAEQCFAQRGFHATSMQEICRAAAMSPGNLYRYFPSKEALIAGICQRDLEAIGSDFSALRGRPDFLASFTELGRVNMIERPLPEIALWLEIRLEAARNPQLAETVRGVRNFIRQQFIAVIETAVARGECAPSLPLAALADMVLTFSDGMMARRLSDPDFDATEQLSIFTSILGGILCGEQPQPDSASKNPAAPEPLHV